MHDPDDCDRPDDRLIWTDTADDAASSLEFASECLARASSDARLWKWFVVACHAGVQGVLALVLERGDGLLVQKPGVTKRTIQAFDAGTPSPGPYMDNFCNLYKKVKAKENLRQGVQPVAATAARDSAVKSLDELRDEFLHFNAKGWGIERDHILGSARECVAIARFFVDQESAILWHRDDTGDRAKGALAQLERQLTGDGP